MRLRWWLGVVGVLAAPLVLFLGVPVLHDLQHARWLREAVSVPFAEGEVVGSRSRFGILFGNSNHCDSVVWVAVDSTSPPAAFVEALPPGVFLWAWSITDPERPALVAPDGTLVALGADRSVAGAEWGLEQADLVDLQTLGLEHPVAAGHHLYAMAAVTQSFDTFDLLDLRCH